MSWAQVVHSRSPSLLSRNPCRLLALQQAKSASIDLIPFAGVRYRPNKLNSTVKYSRFSESIELGSNFTRGNPLHSESLILRNASFQPSEQLRLSGREKRSISMAAIPEKMKAWQYTKYGGGAQSLEQVEKPVPKPGPSDILLKIHASAVNPVDWKIQSGDLKALLWLKFPIVPGTDIAGTVAAVGSGVTGYAVGDRILTKTNLFAQGAFAEYALADTKAITKLPTGVSFEDAAGLPVAAATALQGLIKGGLGFPKGRGRVLVQAASGGVGHYAVQLAKYAGAHVTATASSRNIDLVKSLGADEVLDYKNVSDPNNPFQSTSKQPYDIILHCTSKEEPWEHWQKVLSKNGKVISFTPGAGYLARAALQAVTFSGQKLIPLVLSANSKDLQTLVNLLAEKKLKTVIDSTIPLSDARKAWEKSISGRTVGKIIVKSA